MLLKVFRRLKTFYYELNLFRSPEVLNNRHQIRNQYISTRILILLFPLILLSLFLYLLVSRTTITITTKPPSLSLFQKLNQQFHGNLQCSCSNLSIPYRTFLSLEAIYHPICSFDLEQIIENLFNYTQSLSNDNDFRFSAALQFRLLTLLCSSVNEIITAHLIDFNATLFTNIFLLEESNLQNQVNELIEKLIRMISIHFINSLKMIRINTFGSQLISGVRSNYRIIGYSYMSLPGYPHKGLFYDFWLFGAYPKIYDDLCDCSASYSCSSPAWIYNKNETYSVEGFRIGCFVLESLLASSLKCFYDRSCLNQFLQHIQLNSTVSLPLSTKFNRTDTIETLLNGLMVEEWIHSIDYKAYFTACRASTCSYSVMGHRPLIIIITTILGLIGGLETILFFIISISVAFVRKKRHLSTNSNQYLIRRLRRVFNYRILIKQIRRVNLFKTWDSHTELDIRNEFLSTRIYLTLLIFTLSILIHYYSLLISIVTVTIKSPSLDTIVSMNKSSMICPCSKVNIPFKTFTSIQPRFHSICSSDFIDDEWFRTVNIRFRVLSLFCELAKQTFESQLHQWGNSYLLSIQLLSKNQLESERNVSLDQTIAMARSTFANSFELVVNTTQINRLLSADEMFQPGGAMLIPAASIPTQFRNFRNPQLLSSININRLISIVFNQSRSDCDVIQALLKSSLLSFYDVNMINSLNYYLGNASYHPIDLPIVYSKNATISFILNTLMLDTYSMNSSYEIYFNHCNPKACTYTKVSRESSIDIILAAIGLVGGLTGIFHFVIWHLVRCIRKPTKRSNQHVQQNSSLNLISLIRNKLQSMNLFRHSRYSERNELISTRVFIVLFMIILVIFLFYTSLTLTTRSETIHKPNYETFASLRKDYSQTLTCPCSNMAISYRSFVSFSPEFHQICSSVFIDDRFWNLFISSEWMARDREDLSRFVASMFTTIGMFCNISQKTVEEQSNLFLTTRFVSRQAMNEQQFYAQIYSSIQAMIQTSQRRATILIKLIRDTTYSNQIISNLFSNINMDYFVPEYHEEKVQSINLTNYRYGNCSCLTSPSCIQKAYFVRDGSPTFYFDGFFIGCYILEGILQSSMRCLYSQKCINQTLLSILNSLWITILPFPYSLNMTENSSYTINTTFSQLLDNLMIETWGQTISHQSYYQACKPLECTYTFIGRRELTYIVTVFFGVMGGLNQVLTLIVPRFVSFIMKYVSRNQITPSN